MRVVDALKFYARNDAPNNTRDCVSNNRMIREDPMANSDGGDQTTNNSGGRWSEWLKGVAGAVIGSLVTAAILGISAKEIIDVVIPDILKLPTNSVIAIDDPNGCPKEGWTEFTDARGRMIIGAGQGKDLSDRPFRQTAGQERIPLSEQNLPSHKHDTVLGRSDDPNQDFGIGDPRRAATPRKWEQHPTALTSSVGDGEPHDNMPPYIPLHFCKKL